MGQDETEELVSNVIDLIQNKKAFKAISGKSKSTDRYTPKCPTCGSPDVKRIGGFSRGFDVGFLGLASDKIGKTMECKNCGYMW